MDKKLRQVTDNIHGTIFLSSLESDLISTPYFYRLHDIYQSSTVYMTFPSNRTKRYEHSLGTMEMASSIVFSAVSNASSETRNELFKKLQQYFEKIIELAIYQSDDQIAPYFTKCKNDINDLFAKKNLDNDLDEIINHIMEDVRESVVNNAFYDSALDHYQHYPMNMSIASEEIIKKKYRIEDYFLYRCLLQAVRLVALFHDVGHPPYSHIIESVLDALYIKSLDENCGWNGKRKEELKKLLTPYATKDTQQAYKCKMLYSSSSSVEAHLHERIGLNFLQLAIDDTVPELIKSIINSGNTTTFKTANIMYYIFVVELVMGILTEKDLFFKSFHKIVDGPLDADRLDYIMRDSLNTGIDWGKIPYKRLINSNKLFYLTKDANGDELTDEKKIFVIAYPKKTIDDIIDLLVLRYKIFARINFHHRCIKTAVALQSSVFELAEDFLKKSGTSSINPDIKTLWEALSKSAGNTSMRVIQWNDSWLISVLHKSLVNLVSKTSANNSLRENLEEILLNRKRFYTLIKRGSDSQEFVKMIFDYAEITDEMLNNQRKKEYLKYYSEKKLDNTKQSNSLLSSSAEEALKRINDLQTAKQTGDLELLNQINPLVGINVYDTIKQCLEDLTENGVIADYYVFKNEGRKKNGLPSHNNLHEEIYIYKGNNPTVFNDSPILEPQIRAIMRTIPWIYIYYVPPKDCKNISELSKKVFTLTAQAVGVRIKSRYEELYSDSNSPTEK